MASTKINPKQIKAGDNNQVLKTVDGKPVWADNNSSASVEQVQSDWLARSGPAFIKNKPDVKGIVVHDVFLRGKNTLSFLRRAADSTGGFIYRDIELPIPEISKQPIMNMLGNSKGTNIESNPAFYSIFIANANRSNPGEFLVSIDSPVLISSSSVPSKDLVISFEVVTEKYNLDVRYGGESSEDSTEAQIMDNPVSKRVAYRMIGTVPDITIQTLLSNVTIKDIMIEPYEDFTGKYIPGLSETMPTTHIGQVIMSTKLSTAEQMSNFYGGSWSAWGQGRVPIGVGSNGDNSYANANLTGGTDNVSLAKGNIPKLNIDLAYNDNGQPVRPNKDTLSGNAVHWTNKYRNVGVGYPIGSDNPTPVDNRQAFITVYYWVRTA